MVNQRKIDAKIVKQKKAVGADDEGGQDRIVPGQRIDRPDQKKPQFRGIRHQGE